MKNSDTTKNQHLAEPVERKEDTRKVSENSKKSNRSHNENEKDQVSSYSLNRGYYSRNGGDKGYRGL